MLWVGAPPAVSARVRDMLLFGVLWVGMVWCVRCVGGGGGVIRGYGTLIGLVPRYARVGIGLKACSRNSAPPQALPVVYVPPALGGGGGSVSTKT